MLKPDINIFLYPKSMPHGLLNLSFSATVRFQNQKILHQRNRMGHHYKLSLFLVHDGTGMEVEKNGRTGY